MLIFYSVSLVVFSCTQFIMHTSGLLPFFFTNKLTILCCRLNHLTLEVLIDRLMMRKLFWLAFEICKYLKMPGDNGVNKVLSTWACDKVY